MRNFVVVNQRNEYMESKKIVHVHLKEPYEGKADYYFGSLRAIYSIIPEVVLGLRYKSLTAKKFSRYENKNCVIIVDVITRNPQSSAKNQVIEE